MVVKLISCSIMTSSPTPEFMAVYIPPFEPVKWDIKPGFFSWVGFASNKFYDNFPKKPVAFVWDKNLIINTPQDLEFIFASDREFTSFDYKKNISKLAQLCKNRIDGSFTEAFSLSALAKELSLSSAAITKAFKSAFEITPKSYMSRLRLLRSLNLIFVQRLSSTDSCYEGGFGDYSRFGRICNNVLSVPPSKFQP